MFILSNSQLFLLGDILYGCILSDHVKSYQILLDLFRSCWISSDPVGHCQILSDLVRSSWTLSDFVRSCQILYNFVYICFQIRCALCGAMAKSRNSLNSHMSRQHRGISIKVVQIKLKSGKIPLCCRLLICAYKCILKLEIHIKFCGFCVQLCQIHQTFSDHV